MGLMERLYFLPVFLLVFALPMQAQNVTNAPSNETHPPKHLRPLTPEEQQIVRDHGLDPTGMTIDMDVAAQQIRQQQQASAVNGTPTPPDLKNAMVWLDHFMGGTNAMILADVISIKTDQLKFRLAGQDYDYSGHFTVMLRTPRKHKNPYFGFGTPEKAKIVFLNIGGGQTMLLGDATIWKKSNGFIDVESQTAPVMGEWIHSGSYQIQN